MLYFALNTRTQFSQVLCHFITRVKFSPVSIAYSSFLSEAWDPTRIVLMFILLPAVCSWWWYIYICIYMYMCAQSFQSCLTLCDPVDHGPPGSSVHEILQARILKWVAISFSSDKVWSEWSEVTQPCLTLRPHRLQLTRLPCLWDFPGKSTGVGCHCLLQICVCVCVCVFSKTTEAFSPALLFSSQALTRIDFNMFLPMVPSRK